MKFISTLKDSYLNFCAIHKNIDEISHQDILILKKTSQKEQKKDEKKVLEAREVPEWCTEPYIHSGYLPQGMPLSYYIQAMFFPNYELMNIWTNFLPMIYFVYLISCFNQEMDIIRKWPLLIICLGSITVMSFSGIAHMFHSKSMLWHKNCFLLDYFGITFYAICSTTANWFASSPLSYFNILKSRNITILVTNGCIGFFCLAFSKVELPFFSCAYRRRYLKVFLCSVGYMYGMVPIFYRIYTNDVLYSVKCNYMLQFLFMALNYIFFTSDFPQKYWPRKFDIFFHSHQLFHISVAFQCYFSIFAVYYDVVDDSGAWQLLSSQIDYPCLLDFFKPQIIYFCICALSVLAVNLICFKKVKTK